MTFREIGADFYESVRRTLRDCVCGGGGFGYMQGDHRWEPWPGRFVRILKRGKKAASR